MCGRHFWPLECMGLGGGGLVMLVASREKVHFQAMPGRMNRKLDGGATSPAVILCSCVGSSARFLIRGRIPVPLCRTWRLFDPSGPTDVRRFPPVLAGRSCLHCSVSQLVCYNSCYVKRSCRSVHFIQSTKSMLRPGLSIWHVGFARATRAANCARPSPEEAVDTRFQGSGWTCPARRKDSKNVRLSSPLAVLGTPAWWGLRRVKNGLDSSVGGARGWGG